MKGAYMTISDRLEAHGVFIGLTNVIFTVFEVLLGLRFVFRLFAANSIAPFVSWLYATTDVLVSPFRGIFQTPIIESKFVFDITALVALVIYGLIFALIIYLFDFAFGVRRNG